MDMTNAAAAHRHTADNCDEACSACPECYLAGRAGSLCDRLCPHADAAEEDALAVDAAADALRRAHFAHVCPMDCALCTAEYYDEQRRDEEVCELNESETRLRQGFTLYNE